MPWTRFYEEPDLAMSLLTYVAASPHQRYLQGLKEAATTYLGSNKTHLLSYKTAETVPLAVGGSSVSVNSTASHGLHVNYGYVAKNEMFVAPFGRFSVFIPANSNALTDKDVMLPGFYIPASSSRLIRGGSRKTEVMGYLVENHIVGTLFEPAKSTQERIVLGAVAFVKLAAAVAAAVTTFGAGSAALAAAIPDAISQVRQLVETIRSEVPGVVSALQEAAQAGQAFRTAVARGGHSGTSSLSAFGSAASGSATTVTGQGEASGVDVFGTSLSRDKTSAAAIQEQVRLFESLRMVCIQQITPIRTELTDISDQEFDEETHPVIVDGKAVTVKARIPKRARYTVSALAYDTSLIRVGECPREAYSAFMFTNAHALTDAAQKAALRPWSARLAPSNVKKDEINYFAQLERHGAPTSLFGPYTDTGMSYNDRVFTVSWDSDDRWSTYQRATIRGSLPDELIVEARPTAIDSARREYIRAQEEQRRAEEAQRLQASIAAAQREQAALRNRSDAMKVRLIDAATFHTQTAVSIGWRHASLQQLETGLSEYHQLSPLNFASRFAKLDEISRLLGVWKAHISGKDKPNPRKLATALKLESDITEERTALAKVI